MEDNRYPRATRAEIEKLLEDTRSQNGSRAADRKPWTPGRVIGTVFSTLLLLILLGILVMLLVTKAQGGSPSLFGYRIYIVETGSMEPTLPVGTAIVVKALGPDDALEVGTVVTYRHENSVITHRIVSIEEQNGVTLYHTKGDNPQNSVDPWTSTRADVIGTLQFHVALPSFGSSTSTETSGGGE